MTSTDPISDMLTRIRNAIAVNKNQISLPYSLVKRAVADLLAKNNFIAEVDSTGSGIEKQLVIKINDGDKNAAITDIKRLSRPGRRHYVRASAIPTVKSGRGMVIVSTSRGIMSGDAAKKAKVGGELICRVY